MAFENVGGRETHFGPDGITDKKFGALAAGGGKEKEVVYEFSYDDLPAADDGNEMLIRIPALSQVVSATLFVGTAWAGGTSINLGLAQTDGTAIDADGLDAAVATAALTAGAIIEGDGALIGASVGSADGVLVVAATGTYTAGTAKLVLKYKQA